MLKKGRTRTIGKQRTSIRFPFYLRKEIEEKYKKPNLSGWLQTSAKEKIKRDSKGRVCDCGRSIDDSK